MGIRAALKELGKKCNTSGTAPSGNTITAILNSMASSFNINGTNGTDGVDGKSVTAITLTVSDGAVTGGTATLSDNTEIEITVTTAAAGE